MKLRMLIGLGCFWGVEAAFGYLHGVLSCKTIYSSGVALDARFDHLNDHAEGVLILYDTDVIPTEAIADAYIEYLMATRSSADPRYRLFIWSEDWTAPRMESYIESISKGDPIVRKHVEGIRYLSQDGDGTAMPGYFDAEIHHQKVYLRKQPGIYDHVLTLAETEKDALETYAATKINGFLAGNGTMKELSSIKESLGLPESIWNKLYSICLRYMRD